MKSVLISIKPKWCEKIASGEKTIEVRKSAPKEVPFKAYIYATRPKNFYKCGAVSTSDELLWLANGKVEMGDGFKFWADGDEYQCLNGRIIGEFICDKVMFLTPLGLRGFETREKILKLICLTNDDLKIYDKPKELSEFKKPHCDKPEKACEKCKYLYEVDCFEENGRKISRPPQSWMNVEEVEQ